jgi:sodium/proline symporter
MCRRFKSLTDRYDSITVPDYLEERFRDHTHRLRLAAAGALVVFVTIYVSAQIDATGKAFESFLGWNYFLGIAIGFAVVLVYIVAGGFLAVAWSDVFQGSLMFLGLTTLPIVGLVALGGPAEMTDRLRAIDPGLLSLAGPGDGWTFATILSVVSFLLIGLGFLGSPQIFVRFIALRDKSEIRKGAAVAIVFTVLSDLGAVLIGMVGRALLTGPGQDLGATLGGAGEDVLPLLVDHLLPLLLTGVFVAIVLSAIMSTIDSLLVLAGSALVRDVYQKVLHPELPDAELVSKSRAATFALAAMALVIAVAVALITPDRTVFWFVIFGWSGISATFCPTMILSLFWSRLTANGALAAMIVGFTCVPLFKFVVPLIPVVGPEIETLGELPPAFLLSGIAAVLVSLLDGPGRARLAGAARELTDARG